MRSVRVFLASSADVADERALALKVLQRLSYDPYLRGEVHIETVAWDKPGAGTAMLATMTPQEVIAWSGLLPTPGCWLRVGMRAERQSSRSPTRSCSAAGPT